MMILLRDKKKPQRKALPYQLNAVTVFNLMYPACLCLSLFICIFKLRIKRIEHINISLYDASLMFLYVLMGRGGETGSLAHGYEQGTPWDIMSNIPDRALLFNYYKLIGYRCCFV
jgi:hypothetical protein